MKFQKLLVDDAEGVKASERVVAGEVGGPCTGDEVAESSWEWLDLPSSAKEVVVGEGHDPRCVTSNEEVAAKAEGGDARKDFHSTYGGASEAASDPTNGKILDTRHMLEVLESASPVERVPKWQPIGKHRDHTGVVAQHTLSGP